MYEAPLELPAAMVQGYAPETCQLHVACMPPVPGSGPSAPAHLVVALHGETLVAVFPLPAAPAHQPGESPPPATIAAAAFVMAGAAAAAEVYSLPLPVGGGGIDGLAGDPLGTALLTSSHDGLHVFVWPLTRETLE